MPVGGEPYYYHFFYFFKSLHYRNIINYPTPLLYRQTHPLNIKFKMPLCIP